jgi:hypothetical protein
MIWKKGSPLTKAVGDGSAIRMEGAGPRYISRELLHGDNPHLEGERACPPENCGGIGGYEYLLEVLDDPNHEEHQGMKEWAGELDPEKFELKIATVRMVRGLRGGFSTAWVPTSLANLFPAHLSPACSPSSKDSQHLPITLIDG